MVVFAYNYFMREDLMKVRNFKVSVSHYHYACVFMVAE